MLSEEYIKIMDTFKTWYGLLNINRRFANYELSHGDSVTTTDKIAEHQLKKLYEEAENYSELTGVLDMDNSELEVEVYKPLADVDNKIAEYYDDKKAEVIVFKTANGIVNGFVNIKEESDENDTDEEEDDLSDVILIHLTYDQVQDIMDDIDNWSCIGNPYY